MHNFFFLWALAFCILLQGSIAEDQSGYVCLIDKPNPNHCDNFYITELRDILNGVVKGQDRGSSYVAGIQAKLNEVVNWQIKLGGLQSAQAKVEDKLERSLIAVQTKLEGQLQGVEKKLEGQLQEVQTKLEAKLGESLLAVQKKIENQLQAVVNQLQLVQNKIDAAEVKSQLQAKSNKTADPQQPAKAAVPASGTITIPSGFELFGTRYFRIVNDEENWENAEKKCREMGGYLASFRNEEELNAIKPKLGNCDYWLGINDKDKEGHFVSVASHKSAPFLKWREGEPNDRNHEENCIILSGGKMWDGGCYLFYFKFICQADNET